jgi:hypothetical protein
MIIIFWTLLFWLFLFNGSEQIGKFLAKLEGGVFTMSLFGNLDKFAPGKPVRVAQDHPIPEFRGLVGVVDYRSESTGTYFVDFYNRDSREYKQIKIARDFLIPYIPEEKLAKEMQLALPGATSPKKKKGGWKMPRIFKYFIYAAVVALVWKFVINADYIAGIFMKIFFKV